MNHEEKAETFYVLLLNDMRAANIENGTAVYWCRTPEPLVQLLESEKVDPWQDGGWNKAFRQGGPLEWFNPPWESAGQGVIAYRVQTLEDLTQGIAEYT